VSSDWHDTLGYVALDPYRRVLAVPAARQAMLLGILLRVPMFAGGVVLTLHVVGSLGRNYGQAGLVSAAATVCIAISGPWRGRLLDRIGLRRVVVPSIVVTAVCWSIAPFVGYWLLLTLAALAGLFVVPTFSIIRQAVLAAVPEADRRSALSLDAIAVEVSFMIGPLAGVWAATVWPTSWVLFAIGMCDVLAGAALWIADLPLTTGAGAGEDRPAKRIPRREWFTPAFVAVCAAAATSTVVLLGTELSIIAALRDFNAAGLIGPILAIWGLGSMVGGFIYGALHRSIPAFLLLGGLSLATLPLALAPSEWPLAVLSFVAGIVCAPTITATIDQLSRVVPERARGEALGWHGSSMTAGSAIGAPLAGVAIDWWGDGGGFVIVAGLGFAVAVLGQLTVLRVQRGGVSTAEPLAVSPAG
jgi:MFS family permease